MLPGTTVGNSQTGVWGNVSRNVPRNVPRNPETEENLPESFEKEVLALIKQNNKITRKTIADKYKVSEKTVTRRLQKIDVVFEGKGKNGHWEIP